MSELQEGAMAPGIRLATDTGETFDLADYRGRNVVVYFYPKADTPG
jgi:peroxiredoxin Q/BCP